MTVLKNKKILLISARLFGYELEIQTRLKEMGAGVDWYDQRPTNDFLTKSLIRIDNRLLYYKVRNYYREIIRKTVSVNYDYIVFISPETITEDLLIEMKQVQNKAVFILYMWDSLRNKSATIKKLTSRFDFRYSFDREDCEVADYDFRYRPLFFLNDYCKIESNTKRTIDLLFIGTIHSDRFKVLFKLRELCEKKRLSHFYYMFFPSRILFLMHSFIDGHIRKSGSSNFRFASLSKTEVLDYVSKSKVVVDIQHPNQIGLTMRTIEILGARRKLITTNKDIVNYDFYHPQNIQLIDRENPVIDESFFSTNIVLLDPTIYDKYSIDGWISNVFDLK